MIRAAFLWILGSLSELCCAVKYHLFFIFFRCGISSWYVLLFFGFLEVSCSAGSFTLSFTQSLRGGKWFAFNWKPFSCILSYTFYWEENSPSTVAFIPFKFMFLVFFLNLFFELYDAYPRVLLPNRQELNIIQQSTINVLLENFPFNLKKSHVFTLNCF